MFIEHSPAGWEAVAQKLQPPFDRGEASSVGRLFDRLGIVLLALACVEVRPGRLVGFQEEARMIPKKLILAPIDFEVIEPKRDY
jgi:hypothetical protein